MIPSLETERVLDSELSCAARNTLHCHQSLEPARKSQKNMRCTGVEAELTVSDDLIVLVALSVDSPESE